MKILVACEESQRVCTAFRNRGHEAYSCDLLDPSGGHSEWHIKADVSTILWPVSVMTMDGISHDIGQWDMIIAHPPCTFLTVAGNRWFNADRYGTAALERRHEQEAAISFFMKFVYAASPKICIENPVGIMSRTYRKPDQYIQPYEYGHPVAKKTCLWLKGLPLLRPTNIVEPERIHSKGASGGYSGNSWYVRDENGKILPYSDPRTARERSKTFEGIALAMAEQWG